MPLPSLDQYFQLIEERSSLSATHLSDYQFLLDDEGRFIYKHGTTAVVFKARKGLNFYAVRFFLREEPQLFNRYEQISNYLDNKALNWKVDFKYLERGVFFGEHYFPVVVMDWAEGLALNQFIDEEIFNQSQLFVLQKKLVSLSDDLEQNQIGHGDLKFDNILIKKTESDFRFKLVDYDSFYIPAFEGLKNLEPGSPGFQHPRRLASDFSERVDRFSIWVMLTALEALKHDPTLWTNADQVGYNKNRNLLFTLKDSINPTGSKLIQRLKGYNSETLNFYLDKLVRFCQIAHLDSIEKPTLAKESPYAPPTKPTIPAPTPAIKEEDKFDVEIKSNPSGKDVQVQGVKKGITPLKLSLAKKEFGSVHLADGNEKVQVLINEDRKTYDVSFPKKEPVQRPSIEEDEIVEFSADRYTVTEGDLATLNWRVKGSSKIHISNIGEVADKSGRKNIVLKDTTRYVLSIGSKQRSLTISVEPKVRPQPVAPPSIPVPAKKKVADRRSHSQIKPEARSKKPFIWAGLGVVALTIGIFAFSYFSKNDRVAPSQYNTADLNAAYSNEVAFNNSTVTSFLDGLYASYNQRNLDGILKNYSNSLKEYYDEKNMNKDSLRTVINDLFISPASYQCRPDYKTLKIEPSTNSCKVVITVTERLKSDAASPEEKFNTTIEYILDSTFKIISEKNIETNS